MASLSRNWRRIDDDLAPYAREAAPKDRLAHWRDTLGALGNLTRPSPAGTW